MELVHNTGLDRAHGGVFFVRESDGQYPIRPVAPPPEIFARTSPEEMTVKPAARGL